MTLGVLVLGYAGYYVCRSNFSVALPLIAADLGRLGIDPDTARIRLGEIASLGVLAYALGKFANGALTDFLGGRRAFLSGMGLSALCTVGFALSGTVPLFTLAWCANRAVQSMGWVGIVKITARWFSWSAYGTAMAVISLSFLFGDAAARALMGALLEAGAGWRDVFWVAAGVLGTLFAASAWLLRESPAERGVAEPEEHPDNLFAAGGGAARPVGLRALLAPFAASPSFWVVCALSLGLTLLRETFNTWTPTYFVDAVGLSESRAASTSALFPLAGGVSVLLAGWLSDRLGTAGRAWIIVTGLAASVGSLSLLGVSGLGRSPGAAIALVTLTGFLLIGPYSYLAGAISLDFGGKQGSATAAGVIDGVGYLGGILAGGGVARLAVAFGWGGAFLALAGVAALSAAAGALYLRDRLRHARSLRALSPAD